MIDVERSEEAVEVGEPGGWNKDFLAQLQRDFRGKCYLCESYVGPDFQVDHRYPKAEHPELRVERTNLFPACNFCNQHRWKKTRPGGFVSPGDGVEGRLQQWLPSEGQLDPSFCARSTDDLAATNTAEELKHLHLGESPKHAALRKAIVDQSVRIHRKAVEWSSTKDAADDDARTKHVRSESELRNWLSRRAPFTALMRAEFYLLSALFD